MNLGQLVDRFQVRFRDTGLIVTEDQAEDHIEAAYREFIRYARWPFLIQTQDFDVAADQRLVDVGNDIISSLESIYDETNDRLVSFMPLMEKWRFDIFLQQQTGSAGPVFFRVVGSNLFLIPKPNAACTLIAFHFREPMPLENSGDTPEIPERYQEALVVGALAKAYRDDENLDQAAAAQAEFEAILKQAAEELIIGEASSVRNMMAGSMNGAGSGGAAGQGAASSPVVGNVRLTTEG